jgi:hypothetical protein
VVLIHRPTGLRQASFTRHGPACDRAWRRLKLAVDAELGAGLDLSDQAWKALRLMQETGRPLVKLRGRRAQWGVAAGGLGLPEQACRKGDVEDLAAAGLVASNGRKAVLTPRGEGWK